MPENRPKIVITLRLPHSSDHLNRIPQARLSKANRPIVTSSYPIFGSEKLNAIRKTQNPPFEALHQRPTVHDPPISGHYSLPFFNGESAVQAYPSDCLVTPDVAPVAGTSLSIVEKKINSCRPNQNYRWDFIPFLKTSRNCQFTYA